MIKSFYTIGKVNLIVVIVSYWFIFYHIFNQFERKGNFVFWLEPITGILMVNWGEGQGVQSSNVTTAFTVWCETCFPYSQTGKKLMAKCRMLIQENQELGRQLSQGRIAQLEAELALQKKYSEELKSSQDGEDHFTAQPCLLSHSPV